MVLSCGLKLATRCIGSGASWEWLQCRPRAVAFDDQPWGYLSEATKQSMVSSCLCWTWTSEGETMLQTKDGCHQYRACGHLAKGTRLDFSLLVDLPLKCKVVLNIL